MANINLKETANKILAKAEAHHKDLHCIANYSIINQVIIDAVWYAKELGSLSTKSTQVWEFVDRAEASAIQIHIPYIGSLDYNIAVMHPDLFLSHGTVVGVRRRFSAKLPRGTEIWCELTYFANIPHEDLALLITLGKIVTTVTEPTANKVVVCTSIPQRPDLPF